MRIVKLATLSFVFLFLLITIISLFLPSTIRITKTEQINAATDAVMQQISNPSNWKNWYPGLDSAKLVYTNDLPTGVIINKRKQQTIDITSKNEGEVMIEYKIANETKILGGWKVTADQGSVMIQWYNVMHVRWYPWEKFAGILYERSLSDQMKTGLIRLKDLLETK